MSSGISRRPPLPSISTTASSATSGTQKSDGWVAMQCSLQPSTACSRLSPPRASQPAPGVALVAGAGDVVEVGAARPLQQIAADRRGVAKLRRRAGQQRLGDRRKAPGESRVVREVGVADERADAHAAVGKVLDIGRGREDG